MISFRGMIISLIVAILISSNSTYCFAGVIEKKAYSTNVVEIKAEEFIWKYRLYNGKKQKRLWSATRNRWVTDHWIDV